MPSFEDSRYQAVIQTLAGPHRLGHAVLLEGARLSLPGAAVPDGVEAYSCQTEDVNIVDEFKNRRAAAAVIPAA